MSISKKVLGLALTFAVAVNIGSANAQVDADSAEDALLFKIHDITPVKNTSGEVVSCDYNITFYNRSSYTLKSAEVALGWKDGSIQNVIDEEKKEDAIRNPRTRGRAYSETERNSTVDVSSNVEVSALRPHKQVTVKASANTDKCFLLIEEVSFNVAACNVEGLQDRRGRRSGVGGDSCSRLFKYVSADDPQYYLEFKEITIDEQNAKNEAEKKEKESEINAIYEDASASLKSAGNTISSIK